MTNIVVERIHTTESCEKFAAMPMEVYGDRDAWWPPDVGNEVDLLQGRSPLAANLELAPFWALRAGKPVARVTALVNRRYVEHWGERIGHLTQFEALPGQDEAATAVLAEASAWLRSREMRAARSGFAAFLDYPYAIDNYGSLPSFLLRGNPDYYHRYFKNAGFQTEKGLADYTAALTADALDRYRRMVVAARQSGTLVQSWREHGFAAAIDAWTDVTNAAFASHWGWHPVTRAEVRPMLMALEETAVADLSTVASVEGRVVGAVFSVADLSPALARVRRGCQLSPDRGGGTRGALINIGVLEGYRGRGISLALAARSFLTMAQQRMRFAGYTLVLDDNRPSRATARKLGAHVTSNFVVYRREL